MGCSYFERTPRGITLTASGTSYLTSCEPALALLADADERLHAATRMPKGTLVAAVQHTVARGCLTAALPRFHQMYPDIDLDIREIRRATDEDLRGIDVAVVVGWPPIDNVIQRTVAAGHSHVAASPAYWERHGLPARPKDLERHDFLLLRGPQAP